MENLDSRYEEIRYLKDITKSKAFSCSCCGANLGSTTCKSCKEEVKDQSERELIQSTIDRINEVVKTLPQQPDSYNNTINELYCIEGIESVDNYFSNNNYREILQNELKDLIQNHDFTKKEDIEKWEWYTTNFVDKEDKYIYEMIAFRDCIANKSEFSDLFFENCCVDIINKNLQSINVNALVSIGDYSNSVPGMEVNGFVSGVFMKIDRQTIRDLKNGESYGIVTLFHEMRHMQQKKEYKEINKPNISSFVMLSDQLLSYDRNYYNENYDKLSFELDAEYTGSLYASEFCNSIGLKLPDKLLDSKRERLEAIKDVNRTVNGREESLFNILTDDIKKNPELLDNVPYLNYLYVNDNGSIRMKSQEEIEMEKESFDYSSLNEQEKQNAELFFNFVGMISNQYGQNDNVNTMESVSVTK